MQQVAFVISTSKKYRCAILAAGLLAIDDSTKSAISENSTAPMPSFIDAPRIRFLSARRTASLPDFRAASLIDYSLIAPSACRLFRLHTVRAAFSERPSRRSRDVVTVRQPIAHARVYRLRSPHRSTQPYRLTPSMPPHRQDMAAARPSRRMAPRGAGRESLTCLFGAGRHGSRWC